MAIALKRPSGMHALAVVCLGQTVSLLGTGMTGFALAVWAYEVTGSATALSLLIFFAVGPAILLGPTGGAIVDRANRKRVMILADVVAALTTAAILLLYATGHLQIWHLYAANLMAGICHTVQMPAYEASITLLVPKDQYGRANGLLSLAYNISEVGAPLLAGALIGVIGLGGIMAVDLVTFAFAVLMVVLVAIPQPRLTSGGRVAQGSLWSESAYGFRYILKRPGLLGIQLVFLAVNLALAFQWALQSPFILARTGQDERVLGLVLSALGLGSVAGGLVMSAWGGPRRRVHGVLAGMALECLLGLIAMGLGQVPVVWMAAGFLLMFFVPIANGSNQAIWQAKVAPDLQGRVFGARRMIARFSYLIGLLLAGPLADRLFEPAMQPGGALARTFAGLFGAGPGAGMAFLLAFCGVAGAVASLAGYLVPAIRNVEAAIPDHVAAA